MASRLRSSPSSLFDLFAEICYARDEDGPFIRLKYPNSFAEEDILKQLPSFAFPCEPESHAVEHFTFTLTDIEGKRRFGFCRLSAGGKSCLCFVSWLPWFDIFYKILNKMSALLKSPDDDKGALPLLAALLEAKVPAAGEKCDILSQDGTQEVVFEAPHLDRLPSLTIDRNLAEYCNALDYRKQITIFASLLNERRIIFTSLKISRLSACVHACAALIYPMHWQHIYIPVLPKSLLDYCSAPMPYLIGVHAYLKDNLRKMDIGDAIIVDTDHNEITTSHSDVEDLPYEVYSALKKRLKVEADGDHVARSCLRALVMLIGGYREGARSNGKSLEFNSEAFLATRPTSMRPFLKKMLDLQIFQQFVDERIDLLNKSQGYDDLFEAEITLWSDKAMSNSKRKLVAGAKKLQKESKDQITGLASMVKTKGKMAVKSLRRRLHEEVKHDDGISRRSRRPQRVNSYKQSMSDDTDAPADARMVSKRPPRPPMPNSDGQSSWVKRSVGEQVLPPPIRRESYNKARHYNPLSFDDDDLAESRVSINLMEDPDIQSIVKKSFSMEDITAADITEDSGSSSDVSDESADLLSDGGSTVLLRDPLSSSIISRSGWVPVAPPRRSRGHQRPVQDSLTDHADASSINSTDSGSGGCHQPTAAAHVHPPVPGIDMHDLMDVHADSSGSTALPLEPGAGSFDPASRGGGGGGGSGGSTIGRSSSCTPKEPCSAGASAWEAAQHPDDDASAAASKAAPVRRAAPRIEQLQRELLDRVTGQPMPPAAVVAAAAAAAKLRPVTCAPAIGRDSEPAEVSGGGSGSAAKGREPPRSISPSSSPSPSSSSGLHQSVAGGSFPRKDATKRQTIFGDPRQLRLLPPALEEDEEMMSTCCSPALANPPLSAGTAAAAAPAGPRSFGEQPFCRAPMAAAAGRAQCAGASSAIASDGEQLHEDLVGLQLGPISPQLPPPAAVEAAAAPGGRRVAARQPNYFVSLPLTPSAATPTACLAAGPPHIMGFAAYAVRQPLSSVTRPPQQPAGGAGLWLALGGPGGGSGGSPGRGVAAIGSSHGGTVQPGSLPSPPLLHVLPDRHLGGRTAEQQQTPGSPLRPKSAFAGSKSPPTAADPFADLVNLKSHIGAAAGQQL